LKIGIFPNIIFGARETHFLTIFVIFAFLGSRQGFPCLEPKNRFFGQKSISGGISGFSGPDLKIQIFAPPGAKKKVPL
jgi:hypothetical protein